MAAEASATGHSAPGQRTFDCPWCGAISRIPADHLGEHFTCPECRQATKLTQANTSSLSPTAPPPDAPHLVGDRTFDCPWCGAISSIPSSHLGEHFACPECGNQTKLTEKNTTRRPATEPPPEAPHVAAAGTGRGVVVALVLVLVGAGIWLAVSGGKKEPTPPTPPATASGSGTPTAVPEPARPADVPPTPTPPATPPREPVSPVPDGVRQAETRLTDAKAQVALAEARLAEVRKRLAPFTGAEVEAARQNLVALREVAAESAARRERLGPDPTVDDVRGHNLEMIQVLGASSARTRVAEAALARLRSDPYGEGREVIGLTWREMNFFGHGFRRALAALEGAWSEAAKPVPPELHAEETAAVAALDAAKGEQAAAEAALSAARAPR